MRRKYIDLVERVGWTFIQGFAAEWILTTTFDQQGLKIGLIAGAVSAAKSVIGFQIGNGDSASTHPAV